MTENLLLRPSAQTREQERTHEREREGDRERERERECENEIERARAREGDPERMSPLSALNKPLDGFLYSVGS